MFGRPPEKATRRLRRDVIGQATGCMADNILSERCRVAAHSSRHGGIWDDVPGKTFVRWVVARLRETGKLVGSDRKNRGGLKEVVQLSTYVPVYSRLAR